jgi:hypothetical protein
MKSLFAVITAAVLFGASPSAEARTVVVRGPAPVLSVRERQSMFLQKARVVHLLQAARADGRVSRGEAARIRAAKRELRAMNFVFRSS